LDLKYIKSFCNSIIKRKVTQQPTRDLNKYSSEDTQMVHVISIEKDVQHH
jgi:hypothetical protein